jgi:hypothetical protein
MTQMDYLVLFVAKLCCLVRCVSYGLLHKPASELQEDPETATAAAEGV